MKEKQVGKMGLQAKGKRILSAFLAVMMAVAVIGTIQITAPVKAEAASAKKVTVATPKLPQVVRKNSRALKLPFKRVKGAKGYEIQRAMWLGGASGKETDPTNAGDWLEDTPKVGNARYWTNWKKVKTLKNSKKSTISWTNTGLKANTGCTATASAHTRS